MEKFQRMAKTGQDSKQQGLKSKHDNTITDLRLKNVTQAGDKNVYSTTGLDSRIYEWSVPLN